jgi:hypothetical protein
MGRRVKSISEAAPTGPGLPGADELLVAFAPIVQPLIQLMVAQGVDYTRFVACLKPLFLEQAQAELERRGQKITDSALSVLSGVHRKDVKVWREQGLGQRLAQTASLGSLVFTCWKDEPAYCDHEGNPKPLPRTGPWPSFETLVRTVSTDVHPYTVLNDLLRLGIARLELVGEQECVALNGNAFIPPPGSLELLQLFSSNLADHVATAASNLLGEEPGRLEQSVFADGLSAESVERLSVLSRSLWEQVHTQMITMARRLYEQDKDGGHRHRMRFGAYYHTREEAADDAPQQEN